MFWKRLLVGMGRFHRLIGKAMMLIGPSALGRVQIGSHQSQMVHKFSGMAAGATMVIGPPAFALFHNIRHESHRKYSSVSNRLVMSAMTS